MSDEAFEKWDTETFGTPIVRTIEDDNRRLIRQMTWQAATERAAGIASQWHPEYYHQDNCAGACIGIAAAIREGR